MKKRRQILSEIINKQLIINTDSMDSGMIKLNKETDSNKLMMKRRLNPPATMTTSATSQKQHELVFSK